MIDHDRKLIYIHIPKTGGNSINRIFGVDWGGHVDLAAYAKQNSTRLVDQYYSFAVVRNPWARLFSDYNFQRRKSRGTKLHVADRDGRTRSFADWVAVVFDDPFAYLPADWGGNVSDGIHRWSPQVDWLSIDGTMQIDQVIKLERIGKEFPQVAKRSGLPAATRVPKRNWRFHLPYWLHYSRRLADQVGEYYRQDIEQFDYRFGR